MTKSLIRWADPESVRSSPLPPPSEQPLTDAEWAIVLTVLFGAPDALRREVVRNG